MPKKSFAINKTNSESLPEFVLLSYGGTNRARTYDPMLVRHVLYQLSYDSILVIFYHSK